MQMENPDMTIEAFKSTGPKAVWLFQGVDPSHKRTRSWQNSEHWWTALFSLLMLHAAKHRLQLKLPLRKLMKIDDDDTSHFKPAGFFDCQGITYSDLAVEARMNKAGRDMFEIPEWPKALGNMEPDITIRMPKHGRGRGKAILIENKTVSAKRDRLDDYPSIAKTLQDHQWDVQLIVLISLGNSQNDIWEAIKKNRDELLVLLWEDVLRALDGIDVFKSLFDVPLAPYYEQVRPRTK
jgi:hypothetical protein